VGQHARLLDHRGSVTARPDATASTGAQATTIVR
jgi:hypothetical protein